MRQYRLRTIMALIAIIAVSIWCGMLIERARRPAGGRTRGVAYTVSAASDEDRENIHRRAADLPHVERRGEAMKTSDDHYHNLPQWGSATTRESAKIPTTFDSEWSSFRGPLQLLSHGNTPFAPSVTAS